MSTLGRSAMPTLFLMCGLPGAGKTTLARELERERRALRFTPDDWIAALDIDPCDEPKRAQIEKLQWRLAARALELGVDVVLDFGVWQRKERDEFRARAAALGARTEVRFLEVPREELLARLAARDAAPPPASFRVSAAQLDLYTTWFERPTTDELGGASGDMIEARP
jgi:predicted kinase